MHLFVKKLLLEGQHKKLTLNSLEYKASGSPVTPHVKVTADSTEYFCVYSKV